MMWLILSAIGLIILACIFIAALVGWKLTHPAKQEVNDSPDRLQLSFQTIQFQSRTEDATLQGWFLPARTKEAGMTLILSHGYAGNRLEQGLPSLSLVKSLVESDFNVLLFDFRNCGDSDQGLTSVGYLEQQDLLGAIDWVNKIHPSRIGLIGFSMGAATAIIAAAGEPSVVGIVADSSFNHLKRYLRENLSIWSKLPNFPFTPLILWILPILTGIHPDSVNVLSAVDGVYPRPILFIHSKDDLAIPSSHSEAMWAKHKDRFDFWKTSGAGHVGTYRLLPEEYTSRVIAFFRELQNERNSLPVMEYKQTTKTIT